MGQACQRAQRDPHSVRLIMVSKTVSSQRLRRALDSGQSHFGENKAQELRPKALELADTSAQWHFIGHLQSNKIKDVLPHICLLHSLDRFSLATKLQNKLASQDRELAVLIQVNSSYEDAKSGVLPEQALDLIQQVAELPRLHIRGLMTIGLWGGSEQQTRDCFRRLREVQQQARELQLPGAHFDELSMGMSGDFEWAIEEGATLVRVGSAIFGARPA